MSKRNKYSATASVKPTARGVSRRTLVISMTAAAGGGGAFVWSLLGSSEPAHAETITVWASPDCGCCTGWISYMRGKGYRVVVNNVGDPVPIKISLGIPRALHSCHTAKIGNYIVEGPVPVAAVAKLLEERPELKGIALPGMPEGSPGMPGVSGVYRVFGFSANGSSRPFADVRV